jgi:hypothetical protein
LKNTGSGFRNVTFVLDTRLLLKAFDLEATIDTENTLALLESARRLKGVLCVFPETKDEIQTVLRGIIRGFQHGGARGPLVDELRKRGRGVADVILAASKLEEYLKRLNISTKKGSESNSVRNSAIHSGGPLITMSTRSGASSHYGEIVEFRGWRRQATFS